LHGKRSENDQKDQKTIYEEARRFLKKEEE